MEVLNQNQRRSAIWRIVGIAAVIIAMLGTSLFSIHNQYASFGAQDYEALKKKYDKEKMQWKGTEMGLKNTSSRLDAELKKCKAGNDPNERLQFCEDRIKQKDDDIQKLNAELLRCETKLSAATAYQN